MTEGLGLPERGKHRWLWAVSFVTALAAFCLSFGFFFGTEHPGGPWARIAESLYSSFELLALELPFGEIKDEVAAGHHVHLARFLAAVAAFATGAVLLLEFFGNELWRWWIGRVGGHTVVCGLSRTGRPLAEEFRRARKRVIVIEDNAENPAAASAEECGCRLLRGSPADANLLRKGKVQTAEYVLAALDDDSANVGIAMRAAKLARERRWRWRGTLRIFVQIVDPQLRVFLHERRALEVPDAPVRITMFNVFENCARNLFRRYPLDHDVIARGDPRVVQLVLIGFGLMGEALLLQAARFGQFANLKNLRVHVFDRQAMRNERLFRSRYPQFDRICDLEFHEMDADEPETQALVGELCSDPAATVSTIAITLDNDARAMSIGLSLVNRHEVRVPIRVRLTEDSGLAPLVTAERSGAIRDRMTAFGSLNAACEFENIVGGELSKIMHEDFVQRRLQEGRSADDPGLVKWEVLDADLIESNRQLAEHIDVKLRAIGCHAANSRDGGSATAITEFSAAEVELMAEMEHQRWMAERIISGWTFVDGPRDVIKRTSPYLVPWNQLSEPVKNYDRDAVKIIPGALEPRGLRIFRSPSSAGRR
jgi:voltage-gated potassium channel Kch